MTKSARGLTKEDCKAFRLVIQKMKDWEAHVMDGGHYGLYANERSKKWWLSTNGKKLRDVAYFLKENFWYEAPENDFAEWWKDDYSKAQNHMDTPNREIL